MVYCYDDEELVYCDWCGCRLDAHNYYVTDIGNLCEYCYDEIDFPISDINDIPEEDYDA